MLKFNKSNQVPPTFPAANSEVPDTSAARAALVSVDGVRLFVRQLGAASSPPVVVLHGIMGHAREWDVLSSRLSHRFRAVAIELRGHGRSDHRGPYTAAAMAGDVIDLIERLDLGRTHLIGHSLGGMVAMLVAARRPDLIDRLVLIDVSPEIVSGPLAAELPGWIEALGNARYDSVHQAVTEWLEGDPLAREPLLRHYAEHNLIADGTRSLRWRFDAPGLKSFLSDGVTEAELWEALDAIAAPTLLVRGEHSAAVAAASAARVIEHLASGELVEIAGGGHDLGVQQPELVAAATLAHLG